MEGGRRREGGRREEGRRQGGREGGRERGREGGREEERKGGRGKERERERRERWKGERREGKKKEGYLQLHLLSGVVVPECRPLQHEPSPLVVLPHVALLGEVALAQHIMHYLVHHVRNHFRS